VLFPLAGYIADAFDKRTVMMMSSLVSAVTALSFVIVAENRSLPLLYILICIKNSSASFFDPARRSALPLIVEKGKLGLAVTLDGMAWSSMLALGSSIGGIVTSKLGLRDCFILDAFGYVMSMVCLFFLPRLKGSPEERTQAEPGRDDQPRSLRTRVRHALREGMASITEKENREPLAFATLKGSGGLVWAPADVLNVMWSSLAKYQLFGDQPLTLGIAYGFNGIGSLLGPLMFNRIFDTGKTGLLNAILIGMLLMGLGFVSWAFSFNVWMVNLGNFLRACGSSIVWIRSTLLLQLTCQQKYLGRMFAIENAIFTVCSSVSVFVAGYVLDLGSVSLKLMCFILSIGSFLLTALWAYLKASRFSSSKGKRREWSYEMVESRELDCDA